MGIRPSNTSTGLGVTALTTTMIAIISGGLGVMQIGAHFGEDTRAPPTPSPVAFEAGQYDDLQPPTPTHPRPGVLTNATQNS